MAGMLGRCTLAAVLLPLGIGISVAAPSPTPTLSPQVHRALERAWDASDAGRGAEAIAILEALHADTANNSYARALVDQQLAYLYLQSGQTGKAIQHFERAVANQTLPADVRRNARYVLAQLLVEQQAWSRARQVADALLAEAPQEPKYLGISAYVAYRQEQFDLALRQSRQAIDTADEVRSEWLQIALNIYIAREDWAHAVPFVRSLVAQAPDNAQYWNYLAQLQLRSGDLEGALQAMALAYHSGLLEPQSYESLAQLWAQYGAPEKAARLLSDWMEQETLAADGRTLEMRGQFWLMARETEPALADLARAAELGGSKAGRLHQTVGEIAFRDRQWPRAVAALERALQTGGLRDPDRVRLLLGVAACQGGMAELARRTLTPLLRTPTLRDQAQYWLTRLDS